MLASSSVSSRAVAARSRVSRQQERHQAALEDIGKAAATGLLMRRCPQRFGRAKTATVSAGNGNCSRCVSELIRALASVIRCASMVSCARTVPYDGATAAEPWTRTNHGGGAALARMPYDSWAGIGRTLVVGVLGNTALVGLRRWSGKRTLSKLNASDLIVTVALGSTLSPVLLNKTVPLSEGLVAFMFLIGLQFVVTWSSVRIGLVRRLVAGEPQLLLLREGAWLPAALRRARRPEREVLAAVRGAGVCDLAVAAAVVLPRPRGSSRAGNGRVAQCGVAKGWCGFVESRGCPRCARSGSSGMIERQSRDARASGPDLALRRSDDPWPFLRMRRAHHEPDRHC